jgi:putative RNA 2'-phosphotransferase
VKSISKYLALVLRHKPEVAGLALDAEGWASAHAVIAAVARKFGEFDRARLETLVRTNDKQRYAFDESGTRIRASQGHSIGVDLKLDAAQPPPFLYHGTVQRFLASILAQGLVKGRRQHVHLSPDFGTALKVAGRRQGETVILLVRSGDMKDHPFFQSANGVWLTDHVPPQFLSVLATPPGDVSPQRTGREKR